MVQEASPSQHRHHLILSREQQLKTKQLMSSYRRHFFHNVAPLSSHSILIYFVATAPGPKRTIGLNCWKLFARPDVDVCYLWLCHNIVYFLINIPTNRNICLHQTFVMELHSPEEIYACKENKKTIYVNCVCVWGRRSMSRLLGILTCFLKGYLTFCFATWYDPSKALLKFLIWEHKKCRMYAFAQFAPIFILRRAL